MLDRSKIGHEFPSYTTQVEKGRLRFFAKATGQKDPIYTNETAAKEVGYPDLPAPPTFPFSMDMDAPDFLPCIGLLNLDLGRVLHGEQEFEFLAPIIAGDEITITSKIKDIYDKKGGALEFIVMENTYTNQNGVCAAKATTSIVYRN